MVVAGSPSLRMRARPQHDREVRFTVPCSCTVAAPPPFPPSSSNFFVLLTQCRHQLRQLVQPKLVLAIQQQRHVLLGTGPIVSAPTPSVRRNAMCSSSLTALSKSILAGMVALKNRLCRVEGALRMISCNCAVNPFSNSRSDALYTTVYSLPPVLGPPPPIDVRVAITTSGAFINEENLAATESPYRGIDKPGHLLDHAERLQR
mmetsp:Transcript_26732/g.53308  ORF Transcript_26732/g.53308 Transcript_26732/m.53308 type:complete len:204 (-) Transcript_26732:354-965(-)